MRGRRYKPYYRSRGRYNSSYESQPGKQTPSSFALPIEAKRNEILSAIVNNQAIVITGETGCGKSTQVPQYILNYSRSNNQYCKIICTQPRRLAAINLAKRVAKELRCKLGELVGYQVGLDPFYNKDSAILFVTTGIFLQRLVHGASMAEFSHIIFDEVHERDLNNDFSMVAAKYLLKVRSNLKVILMSATFDSSLFSRYFSPEHIKDITLSARAVPKESPKKLVKTGSGWSSDEEELKEEVKTKEVDIRTLIREGKAAPTVSISEQKYKLTYYYLENLCGNKCKFKCEIPYFNKDYPVYHGTCIELAARMIVNEFHMADYFRDRESSKQSVLVFVPGFAEIFDLIDCIHEVCPSEKIRNQLVLLPLHSTISGEEQARIFEEVPIDHRKIIIGTNIAESSITIPDLSCVIDFCLSKENHFNKYNNNERLHLTWASQASCTQRAGRAGRVSDGTVFRLIPFKFFHTLQQYSTPEMCRVPLDKLVLQIKTWNYKEPKELLSAAIEPPEIDTIDDAIYRLQDTGALTFPLKDKPTGEITDLGRIYCDIPCDIRITRLCIFGLIFGAMKQALIIASIIQQEKSLFIENANFGETNRLKKKFEYADPEADSDMIGYYNAYMDWYLRFIIKREEGYSEFYKKGFTSSRSEVRWCKEQGLNLTTLKEAYKLIQEIKERLYKLKINSKLIESDIEKTCVKENRYLALKIMIAGAFYPNYAVSEYLEYDNWKRQRFDTHYIEIKNLQESANNILWDLFGQFGSIISLKRDCNRFFLSYDPLIERRAILQAMKMQPSNTRRNNKHFNNHGPYDEISEMGVSTPYEVCLTNVLSTSIIVPENDSLQSHPIEYSKHNDKLYISAINIERRGKLFAKHITRIANIPMANALFVCLFAPKVTFISNKDHYKGINVTQRYRMGHSATIDFTHWFSSADLFLLNSIRYNINSMLNNLIKAEFTLNISEKIIKFLKKERAPKNTTTQLTHLLYKEEELNPKCELYEGETVIKGSDNDLLAQLQPLHIKEDTRPWTEEGMKELGKLYKEIQKRKQEKVQSFNQYIKACRTEDTYVQCAECNNALLSIRQLEEVDHSLYKTSCTFGIRIINTEEIKIESEFIRIYKNSASEWGGCSNGHVCLVRIKGEFYMDKYSAVYISLPNLTTLPWTEFNMAQNFKRVYAEEAKILKERKDNKRGYECPFCNIELGTIKELTKHSSSKDHICRIGEFLE